jgi:transposase-like protein
VALIERNGDVHTRIVASVTQKNLAKCLNECVDKSAIVNTDDSGASRGTVKPWKRHDVVNHSKKQYVIKRADGSAAHVNTCESFFSLLKRGVVGARHHVSREHLPKYANEFAFRWNTRKLTDGERMGKAMEMVSGKRLTYYAMTN